MALIVTKGMSVSQRSHSHPPAPSFSSRSIEHNDQPVIRRNASYHPNLWDYGSMQSLNNGFNEEDYKEELEKMKEDVKDLTKANQENPLAKLELIDAVHRLGLQYQFKAEIKHALHVIHQRAEDSRFSDDIYAIALRFRLLRQHGYHVSQDVFKGFVDETGSFRESLEENVEGLLSLYEASFHGLKGETIIDKAMEFSSTCLKALDKDKLPKRLAMKVDHALDMPIHWRTNRLEARWFMPVYEEETSINRTLLKLAKLDYNIVQSIYMKEVSKLARWWEELGITKLSIFRDRLLEHYLWSILMVFEPKCETARAITTKLGSMITMIDDVYDVYGLLEELELLTDFVNRWDITGIDKLPYTIKTCFLALYNTTNEIGLSVLIERGINIIPYLRKMWADQCKAYLVEAKWYHRGLKPPTLKEYLNSAVTTVGGFLLLQCVFLATTDTLTAETLDSISEIPRIMLSSSLIVRLSNDLGTSSHELARGDVLKSVECYMNETGCSEEAARDHIKDLIRETWKNLNEDMADHYPLSETFVGACLDLARASQCFYQYGDGHGIPDRETKEHLNSVLIQPVPMY
ncbi:terpene synthase 10-like [Punica granatum]|uniref:Terpene synthase 10-like n=1 Tax=Punica granatum TaxID=22663 RepID=A0A6P8DBB4_PUNGR|nr:terpene synthase 10-like [Punica granatum]XP_031394486.1 terpene synthase 10-like [Punica granatum]XP_031394487.1 terpene synthase 10-like [Punica granatum]XP_031394492.1 terpene synthase 10-like [Punica granatum]